MSDLVKVLIIGILGVGVWLALGSPTTIDELKTDVANLKQQFTGGGPGGKGGAGGGGGDDDQGGQGQGQQQADAQQPQPQPDQSQDASSPAAPSSEIPDSQQAADHDHDHGASQGTAAPEPANNTPGIVPDSGNPNVTPGPSPPAATTDPLVIPHPDTHFPGKTKVVHPAPHAIKKTQAPHRHHAFTHPTLLHLEKKRGIVHHPTPAPAPTHHIFHRQHHPHGTHFPHVGTPGWYTVPGHHHCFQGTKECYCTDCSKCDCHRFGPGHEHHVRHVGKPHTAHYAKAYHTVPGDLYSYY